MVSYMTMSDNTIEVAYGKFLRTISEQYKSIITVKHSTRAIKLDIMCYLNSLKIITFNYN